MKVERASLLSRRKPDPASWPWGSGSEEEGRGRAFKPSVCDLRCCHVQKPATERGDWRHRLGSRPWAGWRRLAVAGRPCRARGAWGGQPLLHPGGASPICRPLAGRPTKVTWLGGQWCWSVSRLGSRQVQRPGGHGRGDLSSVESKAASCAIRGDAQAGVTRLRQAGAPSCQHPAGWAVSQAPCPLGVRPQPLGKVQTVAAAVGRRPARSAPLLRREQEMGPQ